MIFTIIHLWREKLPAISLSMIVRNEEVNLPRCLESVKNVADEIVIVDTGSTDKTLDIAKSYNAKIFQFKWINDFSAARNFALRNSTGNFILYLDADETLSNNSKEEVLKFAKSSEQIGCFCTVTSIDNFSKQTNQIKYIRFFRNSDKINFVGKAHEQIFSSLVENNYKILNSNIQIIHYGYDISKNQKKIKAERNLKLLLEEYSQKKTAYISFQIGQSYFILENYSEAEKFFNQAIELKSLSKDLLSECFYYLSQISHNKYDILNSDRYINEALKIEDKKPMFHFLCGKIFQRKQDYTKTLKCFLKALEFNSRRNINSVQVSFLNEEEVVYSGISLAMRISDKNHLRIFTDYLKKIIQKKSTNQKAFNLLIEIINNNSILNADNLPKILEITQENSLEIILQILDSINDINLKTHILDEINKKFPDNSEIIKRIALNYNNSDNTDLAIQILENNYNIICNDPAILFYLASFYIKKNNYKKGLELFEEITNKFPNLLNLTEKINEIKNKIVSLGGYK